MGHRPSKEQVRLKPSCFLEVPKPTKALRQISPFRKTMQTVVHRQFGPGASMMDPEFWIQVARGWDEADLQELNARIRLNAMVERQVSTGAAIGLFWIAK
jgi:hypothetical protein